MTRTLRIEFDGAVYLVTGAGSTERPLVRNDAECRRFLQDFAAVATQRNWRIYAWCLLPDHYSVVVETPHGDLHNGMRLFTGTCTRHISDDEHRGHLFRGTYHAIVIDPDAWLLPVCRHVVLQPIVRSLAASPGEWPWSSFQRTMTGSDGHNDPACTDVLLSHFGASRQDAASSYTAYVTSGIDQPWPLTQVVPPGVLGDSTFLHGVKEHLLERTGDPMAAAALLALSRPSLSDLFGPDARHERKHLPSRVAAATRYGYTLHEIALTLGIHYTTVSRYLHAAQEQPVSSRQNH